MYLSPVVFLFLFIFLMKLNLLFISAEINHAAVNVIKIYFLNNLKDALSFKCFQKVVKE